MDKIKISPYVVPGIRLVNMVFTRDKLIAAIDCLTAHYKMKEGAILGSSRKVETVYVRHLLVYFCRKELRGGVVEVGHYMNRDHTTITYAAAQFQNRIDTNSASPIKLKTIHNTTQGDYLITRNILLQSL